MESRLSYQPSNTASGPSQLSSTAYGTQPSNEADFKEQLRAINEEIADVDQSIRGLQRRRNSLVSHKHDLQRSLAALRRQPSIASSNRKGKAREVVVNYYDTDFPWSEGLRSRLKRVFGHDRFRLCQEA